MRTLIVAVAGIFTATAASANIIDRRALGCIAHVVYGESLNEPFMGQVAVAWSVVFRAKVGLREHGGRDVCNVAYKHTSRVWQYDGAKIKLRDKAGWKKALDVAEMALLGRNRPTMPVMYFCSIHVKGACRWHDKAAMYVGLIGGHRFYLDRRFPRLPSLASYQGP